MKVIKRIVIDIESGRVLEVDTYPYHGPVVLAGGGSKGSSSGATTANIPPELQPLYGQTGRKVSELQNQDPLSAYLGASPTKIAPLSSTQQQAIDLTQMNLSDAMKPLEQSDIVQAGHRYFTGAIQPGIENSATLSGLGRSTALENAKAATEAQTVLPLFQGEQARRDAMIQQGLQAGDVQRSVEQATYNSQQQDLLRRQALAEQALFGPLGQLPSTFGNITSGTTTTSGGGLFKAVIPFLVPIASFFLSLSHIWMWV
jgi:hypothetical protein